MCIIIHITTYERIYNYKYMGYNLRDSKQKSRILFLIGVFAFLVGISNLNLVNISINDGNIDDKESVDDEIIKKVKISNFWTLTNISIDNNWSATASKFSWCSGIGTWSDPYVIENVSVNRGNIGNCITIQNSENYFILNNCTVYGSQLSSPYAGINLVNVSNGKITNSHVYDNYHGIYLLDFCENNSIMYNNVSSNGGGTAGYGIKRFSA